MALLLRTRQAFGDPDYNLVLHTSPLSLCREEALHWYWRLAPRLTRTAGFELGTGLRINTLSPEHVATLLRESNPDSPEKQP
jgi:UDPglucose--hexose-1-phosphate uridylyltransferase